MSKFKAVVNLIRFLLKISPIKNYMVGLNIAFINDHFVHLL